MCCSTVNKFHKKSHVVPEWMYEPLYENGKILMAHTEDESLEKRQKGFYDEFICNDCEIRFGKDDRYASLALGKKNIKAPEYTNIKQQNYKNRNDFIKITGFDFKKLQSFVISVFLRASYQRQKNSNYLIIKKHLDKIRELYLSPDYDDLSYPIFIDQLLGDDPIRDRIDLPYKAFLDNHNAVKFSGCGFVFTMLVSSHEASDLLKNFILKKDGSIIMARHHIQNSPTFMSSLPTYQKIFDKYGPIVPGQRIRPLNK